MLFLLKFFSIKLSFCRILCPEVIREFKKQQQELFAQLMERQEVIVGGDARMDSPGHSAKYGSYTTMELSLKKVIDLQLVQVVVVVLYSTCLTVYFSCYCFIPFTPPPPYCKYCKKKTLF